MGSNAEDTEGGVNEMLAVSSAEAHMTRDVPATSECNFGVTGSPWTSEMTTKNTT